jgi:hypothetical protein
VSQLLLERVLERQDVEGLCGACVESFAGEVHVLCHAHFGVSELIGCSASGQACFVHEGGDGLAEDVGCEVGQAGVCEGVLDLVSVFEGARSVPTADGKTRSRPPMSRASGRRQVRRSVTAQSGRTRVR